MTTSIRRSRIAPMLTATAVADAAHTSGGAGVHVTTIVNVAVLDLGQAGDAPAPPIAPAAGRRPASGALIVDGIVLPGLRFGS